MAQTCVAGLSVPDLDVIDLEGKRVLFVGGLHKSGTSVIARCLAAHPDVSGFRNTGVPENEGQHLQTVYPTAREHGGPGRFAFDPRARLTEDSPLNTRSNRTRLLEAWGPRWDFSRRVLLEKSPPNLIRTRLLQALFPEAAFVLVIRHPLVVALATQQWVNCSIERLLEHWFCAHRLLAEDLPRVHRAVLLRYEDLVSNPSASLARVEEVVGIHGFDTSLVEPGRNAVYLSEWKPTADVRRSVLPRFEAAANIFGYSLVAP